MGYVRKVLRSNLFKVNVILGLMFGVALLPPMYWNKKIRQNLDRIIEYSMKFGISIDGKIYSLSGNHMNITVKYQERRFENHPNPIHRSGPTIRIQYGSEDYLDYLSDGIDEFSSPEYYKNDNYRYKYDNTHWSRFKASWRAKNLTDKVVEDLNLDNLKN